MKTKTEPLFESFQPEQQTQENDAFIVRHERIPGKPLSAESIKELEALAQMPDEDIDFSDIPPMTDEQLANMVRGPWTERVMRTVTLKIDDEVAAWLEENAVKQSHLINLVLKREAQREKRRKVAQGVGEMDKAS